PAQQSSSSATSPPPGPARLVAEPIRTDEYANASAFQGVNARIHPVEKMIMRRGLVNLGSVGFA
ncbi:MAG TPA: hypothetical protein VGM14_26410, partial [Streptosporangiaceae bacterium]